MMNYKRTANVIIGSLIAVLLLALPTSGAFAQMKDKVSSMMFHDIEILAADSMEGRLPGTQGEIKAANYIAKRYTEIGLSPKGTDGYLQGFEVNVSINPHDPDGNSRVRGARNVIGMIDNNAEHTVVIGAHFDHLGHGEYGSLHTGEPAIHNGADDNASGVAMLLALAKALKGNIEAKNNNYLFVAFSGEEAGLLGSNYFVRNATIDINSVNYMINMDMVGRLNSNRNLAINATGTSEIWDRVLDDNNSFEFKLKKDPSGIGASDHSSFSNKGIPSLHFFSGQHEDYHKPSDDPEKINVEGMSLIYQYILDIIEDADDEGKLEFVTTHGNKNDRSRMNFVVTLGVMPDYLYDDNGMRIDGVLDGRVASKAGMKRGDVIIAMDKKEVTDIYSYMEALNQYSKGDKCKVRYLRDGKKKKAKVRFE